MSSVNINRREFLKTNATAAFGLALGATSIGFGKTNLKRIVKIGIVGCGGRGTSLLSTLLQIKGVAVPAVCDINPKAIERAKKMVVDAGGNEPEGYGENEESYKKLMQRDDIDAVIIATPWRWHTPMAVYSMKAGKYTGVEVPAAMEIAECWDLVNTYEKTKTPCMMLENWSFRSDNLAVLNMIRKGLLGQIVHCHCAHSHDCIDHWFFDRKTGKDRWAARYLVNRNRDQYPSHQLGPVISWMDINCGDYFDYVTATATDCFGIYDYFKRKFGPDHPGLKRKYAQGDIVTTVVKTKKGKTIVINYDMQLPRPYDNRWMIQGTRGIYSESNKSVYILDKSPAYHKWEPFEPYHKEYEHRWHKKMRREMADGDEDKLLDKQIKGGHGGTDMLELSLFVAAVRDKKPLPLDIYDAVLMCVTGPLSEKSIARGSMPVKVPDFTRGKWKTKKPYFGVIANLVR